MLEEGDVIYLKSGMAVYADIPMMFVYENRKTSDELTNHKIIIGETYQNDTDIVNSIERVAKNVIESFDYQGFILDAEEAEQFVRSHVPKPQNKTFMLPPGKYVVYKTTYGGGDTGMGRFDTYPDGHHVFCRNLENENIGVDFYQSGCFSAMIEEKDIQPIGKAKIEIGEITWKSTKN